MKKTQNKRIERISRENHFFIMASKTSGKKKKRQPASLISKLNLKLLQDRGRHCFNDWFSAEEIDRFRDNADTSVLDPLFERYQVRMEAALEDFASEEGLSDPTEIIDDFPLVRQLRDSIAAETGPDDAGWRTQAVLAFAAGWTTANVFLGDAAEIADRDRDLDWATHVAVSIALGSAPSN